MNHARILKVTNCLLVIIGYQVHCYDRKSGRYQLYFWLLANIMFITFIYLISFSHHFEHSALLQLIQNFSPFLKRLIDFQLLLGLKVFFFSIYEYRAVTHATNELSSILPKTFAQKLTKGEAYAYFLNFSTLIIAFCICLYVGVEMKFELPPLDNILVFCGLSIPHFVLGGALKMYNVGIWLLRQQMLDLNQHFKSFFCCSTVPPGIELQQRRKSLNLESGDELHDIGDHLGSLSRQLSQLAETEKIFKATLLRQLGLLILLNSNCLLMGTYTRLYYESSWRILFMHRTKNIFQATNCGIFVLIFWDYFTLVLTQIFYERVKSNFSKNLQAAIKNRSRFTESTFFTLIGMYESLKNDFSFKLPGSLRVNLYSFFVLHVFVAFTIAIIVLYHYLHDQIMSLNERFDGLNDDDNEN